MITPMVLLLEPPRGRPRPPLQPRPNPRLPPPGTVGFLHWHDDNGVSSGVRVDEVVNRRTITHQRDEARNGGILAAQTTSLLVYNRACR